MASACSPRANGADCWLRHVPPPPRAAMSATDDPVRPELRATTRMARGKRPRGAGLLRRNGKTIKAPGEARPPRALPNRRASRRRRVMPQTSPSPLGEGGREATGWGGLGGPSTGSPLAEPHPASPSAQPPSLGEGGRGEPPAGPSLPAAHRFAGAKIPSTSPRSSRNVSIPPQGVLHVDDVARRSSARRGTGRLHRG